ncbi:chlorohydrolase family protein [Microlunatus sp. GCM10028923]|uniref:chlorohydrolase family protein n=1 Tax=Microlunatus sp. GCM10028923 TaxID=3273400 RepID=UPI003622EF45
MIKEQPVITDDSKITRIRADHVLGWDGTDHVLITGGEVVYRGATILHVGHGWSGPVDEDLDAGPSVIMPGFIDLDALADIDHCLLDSWADRDVSGSFNWDADYVPRRRHVFDQRQRAIVREFAIAQLARHGVTTFMPIASEVHSAWAETYEDFVDVVEITRRIGLRGYLGPSYRSGVNVVTDHGPDVHREEELGRAGLADAVRFIEYVNGLDLDLVRPALLPCRIETLTPDLMRATAEAARHYDVPVRLHCLQSPAEEPYLQRWYGMGVIDTLEETGLLGTRLLIPHGKTLGDLRDPAVAAGPDVRRLVAAGVPIIHCPLTSARYGGALHTFEAYRKAGLTMVLGTDSFPPDLVRGIDVGVQVAKIIDGRLSAGNIADYLRAGTATGADVLGRPDLGRLAPGCAADLVVADLGDFATGVVEDPIRTLIVNGSGRDITRTVVAGRTVMLDGVVLGVDQDQLARQAQELFGLMRQAYGERDRLGRSADQLFPPTYRREPRP